METAESDGYRAVFTQVSKAAKTSADDALRLLAAALRNGMLCDPEVVEKAGRRIAKHKSGSEAFRAPVRALLLGQCTTSWIATTLPAGAGGRGGGVGGHEGGAQ